MGRGAYKGGGNGRRSGRRGGRRCGKTIHSDGAFGRGKVGGDSILAREAAKSECGEDVRAHVRPIFPDLAPNCASNDSSGEKEPKARLYIAMQV